MKDTKLLSNDKDNDLEQRLTAEYKPHFEGLLFEQRKLLAIRMIIELGEKIQYSNDLKKKIYRMKNIQSMLIYEIKNFII